MKKKVLVVDDEQDIREIIKISLEQDGFEVIEASNGRAAVELAKKEKPNLITLDVMMPEMDGFQAAKTLKEDPATSDIPIIILSVLSQDKDKFVQGIADYISKPFKPDELIKTIKKVLQESGLSKKTENILVVDDEPDVIDIITLCLKDKGFTIIGANNGIDALEKLKIFTPDLIILDIEMPKMNGFELIKQLKKEGKFNSVPIIILTGTFLSEEDKKHGLRLGAIKYMTKPFTIDYLTKEIEEILCRQRS